MRGLYVSNTGSFLKQLGWWGLFLICAFYAAYAFYMGSLEILSLLALAPTAPHRAAPVTFIIHAISGSMTLISGPLQFNRHILKRKPTIHRVLGYIYIGTIWLSSAAGLWITIFFDVNLAAKLVFGLLSILWFSTTTIAYLRIRNRQVEQHRAWMIRSFSLSFFFVTFSFWTPALASTDLSKAVAYPLAVFLSWSLNLLVAELWILRTRTQLQQFRLREGAK